MITPKLDAPKCKLPWKCERISGMTLKNVFRSPMAHEFNNWSQTLQPTNRREKL